MTARSGAFCSPPGATDSTAKGTAMICNPADRGHNRWGSVGGVSPRRRLLEHARKLGIKIKRNTPDDQIKALIQAEEASQQAADVLVTSVLHETEPQDGPILTEPPLEPAGPRITYLAQVPPRLVNSWGGLPDGAAHYHPDGEIGMTADRLDAHGRTICVDGVPLADKLDIIATETTLGKVHPQGQIIRIREIANAVSHEPTARALNALAADLDAPAVHPVIPEGTNPRLAKLINDLGTVPLARGAGWPSHTQEIDGLVALAERAARTPMSDRRLADKIREVALNKRHESKEGKGWMDRLVADTVKGLGG